MWERGTLRKSNLNINSKTQENMMKVHATKWKFAMPLGGATGPVMWDQALPSFWSYVDFHLLYRHPLSIAELNFQYVLR